MAVRLKTWHPDVTFGGAKVGADEVDFYHVYTIMNPSIDATAIATAKGSSPTSYALAENISGVLDYPRNIVMVLGVTSGSTNGAVGTVNGVDQFGNSITEVFTVAATANGGTTVGTKVFSKFVSGTATFNGAGDAANGCTANIGYGTAGTATLFGLPFKIGGTGDVLSINWATSHVIHPIKGNRIGSLVSTTQHAVCAPCDFGTASGVVWAKSTKDQSNDDTSVVGR
jgi:hypothetical protein